MFSKILVANRGEIACRIMRSCKKLGIKTMAVYSQADCRARHVKEADEAVCIGPAPSKESYLRADKILQVCIDHKVDAVHPGYGFLSENTNFSANLADNGIKFIGPSAKSILAMGDKIESKHIAGKAGVNMIPGFVGEIKDEKHAKEVAAEIGYPVMIKATAGGGGKGMRIAWNDNQLLESYRLAKDEAANAFGNDSLLIEKFIVEPRHIEFQILGDSKGNIIYLPERECSVQRRNQKVIEESPSCFITPELRKKMGTQAVALAKGVDYESSGTVEFLVDKNKNFYFLEMNTRLQVEHPVTELVTGVDMVEEMIKIAAGSRLSITQDQVKINGNAVEARIYAEDPLKGFLPSVGHLTYYREPQNVRVDSGVFEGDEIPVFYDPIISKVVTHGETRDIAITKLKQALEEYVIRGVGHNIIFCRDVLSNKNFEEGNYTTKFIQETWPQGYKVSKLPEEDRRHLAEVAAFLFREKEKKSKSELLHYVIHMRDIYYSCLLQGDKITSGIVSHEEPAPHGIRNHTIPVQWDVITPSIIVDGETIQIFDKSNIKLKLQYKGGLEDAFVYTLQQFELLQHAPVLKTDKLSKEILAPMPGAVKSVAVKEGQEVISDQELMVIEAMKMQNIIKSEKPGIIKKVHVKPGNIVAVDDVMVEFV